MTAWDSDYLVDRFLAEAGIQAANEYNEISDICPYLSRGQEEVMELIAQRYPKALYQAPITMTPATDRKTFSFGTDGNGNPIVPLGYVQIATTLAAFSGDRYFTGWQEDRDFMDEGEKIRIPSNRAWGGTLYARFVPTPPAIKVTGTDSDGVVVATAVQPILQPAAQRRMIVNRGVKEWAADGNQRPDIARAMDDRWKDMFPSAMLTYRKRYRSGGGLIDPARWYYQAPDLGSTG